mmetsp:Transcript_26130/g.30515  ORF Transcript_26130/g.30515 Transcript_26130/m.30515 type:complete len:236 (-) Transcript_26130:69-776(-)
MYGGKSKKREEIKEPLNNPYPNLDDPNNQQQSYSQMMGSYFRERIGSRSAQNGNNAPANNAVAKKDEEKGEGFLATVQNKIDTMINYGKNYKWFCLLFLIGFIFLFLSLCFLPVFFVMPKKTATLFNIGAICILCAFGIQYGWKAFFVDQFFCGEKPRNFLSIGFVISLIFCVLFAMVFDSFIGTLIFLILEIVLLIYFIASYFPGGMKGVSVFFKTIGGGIKNACTSCCKSDKA